VRQQMRSFKSIQWMSLGSQKTGEYLGIWPGPKDNSLQIVAANKSTNYQNIYYATDNRGTRTAKLYHFDKRLLHNKCCVCLQ
jgi:hypothetical protein